MIVKDEYYKPKRKYKWGTIIPLIGGMTIGNMKATGNKPEFLISYSEFASNDKHIKQYLSDVPFLLLDSNTNEFFETTEEKLDFNKVNFENVDFVSAVCPCSGLSLMNVSTNKDSKYSRGSHAAQNEWMYKTAEFILEKTKPKVSFGENAPGLFTRIGEGVVENLKNIGSKYGYTFSLYKTNTIFHGIPQKRERTFYFFWKEKNKVPIFSQYRREYKPLGEYLKEIPKDAIYQDIFPGIKTLKGISFIEFIKQKEGKKWRKVLNELKTCSNYIVKNELIDEMIDWINNTNIELDEKEKKNSLKFLNHMKKKMAIGKGWWDSTPHFFAEKTNAVVSRLISHGVHPEEERGLNLRELMYLMGMPHDFQLVNLKHINHIAQNVPVNTARDITFEVLKYLDGNAIFEETTFLKQNNINNNIFVLNTSKKLF